MEVLRPTHGAAEMWQWQGSRHEAVVAVRSRSTTRRRHDGVAAASVTRNGRAWCHGGRVREAQRVVVACREMLQEVAQRRDEALRWWWQGVPDAGSEVGRAETPAKV